MALSHANGKVQWLNAHSIGTQYTISGLSFQPKAIRVWALGFQLSTDGAVTTQHANRVVGFCDGALQQRSIAAFDQDAVATSATGVIARNNCIACTTNGSGATGGILRVHQVNSDGFILEVDATTLSADITILWDVWGGSDITQVVIGDFTASGATGDVDYSAAGMTAGATDQILMLAGCHSTAAMNTGTNTDAGFWTGFAKNGSQQLVYCGNSDDASGGTADTDAYYQGGECLAIIPVGGAATTANRATFSQWNTDGFRLNWLQATTSGQQNIFMAIKGGSWAAGELSINGAVLDATTTVSGLGFTPVGGLLLSGIGQALTVGDTIGTDIVSMGSFSGLSSSHTGSQRSELSNPTQIIQYAEFDEALVKVRSDAAVDYALEIDNLASGSFRLIVTQTIGTASNQWVGFMVFGDAPASNEALMGQVWM